jgi:hypothetical protein
MAIVVIGGHSRNIGKTSLVEGLISAMPEFRWTAVKITQFGHGVCSAHGEPCDCEPRDLDHPFAITEESDRSGRTDTSRFLAAGAKRALWVRTRQGLLAEAMPELRRCLADWQNVIMESNSVMQFVRPDLYLTVLDPATDDFKDSARLFLDRADAVVLHTSVTKARWAGVPRQMVTGKPTFHIIPPKYCTKEIVEFVHARLQQTPISADENKNARIPGKKASTYR